MTAKHLKTKLLVRYATLDDLPAAPPLSAEVHAMSDDESKRRAASDPDAGLLPEAFWSQAAMIEPEGTEQITLRLPRRVLRHFKATGKGYQSRISAVLLTYVDTVRKIG